MNKTNLLVNKLKTSNIDFKVDHTTNSKVMINSFPFEFDVNVQNGKVDVQSRIKGWNFVTDFMSLPFEKTLGYLLLKQIGFTLLFFVFMSWAKSNQIYTIVILIMFVFTITAQYMYYMNYRKKHKDFKNNIEKWINENEF
ncbi:hypothetical protein [Seonamhaeicola marinus]|uniref:Uncharacterized protein n=1 Tax=Seonamhaeicola marinus TaxID=1912246 RepID=A0A5D0HSG6_9FLAO|nr:hypothetical protein [Seonamhaeicola marinus]TYA74294.1 hypothetical protein FUA24_13270 [Seonamhaeicola marinus]